MKRFFVSLLVLFLGFSASQAVLKEKDLARTLAVLRAELTENNERMQVFMASYEQQGIAQHQQLVNYMTQCEQIGLMLYSQNPNNTFDMAYACQQATNLYRQLRSTKGKTLPYDRIIASMKSEIERYDALIANLKSMPPVSKEDADEVLTENDSILMQAIDSLVSKMDSLTVAAESTEVDQAVLATRTPKVEEKEEPLFLTGQLLEDRKFCLEYAQQMRDNLQVFLEKMEAESSYYTSLQGKVKDLNQFAQSRYKMLQDNIFKNGSNNYFKILANLPRYAFRASSEFHSKYVPFKGHESSFSEWRGIYVVFLSFFLAIYLALSLLISYVILRWLLPKSWRGKDFKLKRRMLNNVVGIALFAIVVMIVHTIAQRNFIQMGTSLVFNMAWLLEAIFLSLYIRLKGEQMRHAAAIYTPLMIMSFIVILFRIILVPNSIVDLIYPPILLAFNIWQIIMSNRHRQYLPLLDKIYTSITTLAMVAACVASWMGFSLLAVQIMIWWTFQLAAIMTITSLYDLMEMFEDKYMLHRIAPQIKAMIAEGKNPTKESERMISRMRNGDFIEKTWGYDLINRTLVPIMAVGSILISIYWSAQIFEMTSVCQSAFKYNFIDEKNLIQVSLFKLCIVAAMWFIFRYLNYAIRSLYSHFRRQAIKPGENLNLTLAKNVIAILCWGIYIIFSLVVLKVPKDGISIVGAGLATGLGFAMQSILENFFYGISLMTGRLRVGDYIECDGINGKVESITYQSTQIITADGCVISLLNSALFSKNFKNMTRNHSYELIKIPVGVAYGTDVNQVRQMLTDAITPICQETNDAGKNLTDIKQPVKVAFSDFGDNSVDLKVCIWMLVEEKIAFTGRVKEIIYNTLNANNIEIPFPQRDVYIRQMATPK